MLDTRVGVLAVLLVCSTSLTAKADDAPPPITAHAAWSGENAPTEVPALMPSVRMLGVDGSVTGTEPDPESFDRAGLELWWQHYRQLIAMRAQAERR